MVRLARPTGKVGPACRMRSCSRLAGCFSLPVARSSQHPGGHGEKSERSVAARSFAFREVRQALTDAGMQLNAKKTKV
eukprot:4713636-Amphidinium_carterae.1